MASKTSKASSKVRGTKVYLPPSPPPADLCHQLRSFRPATNGSRARQQLVLQSSTPSPPALEKQVSQCDGELLEEDLCSEPPVLTPDSTPTKSSKCGNNSDSEHSVLEEHSYCKPSPPPREIQDVQIVKRDSITIKIKIGAAPKKTAKKRVRSTKRTTHTPGALSSAPNTPVQKHRKSKPKASDNNTKVTDFFPVRRSNRKTAKEIKREQESNHVESILNKCEDGLKVVEFVGKGRGVISTKPFHHGDFVVEYVGDLINLGTAKDRENEYSLSPETGCYMYYFKHNNKSYCVDATAESGKLGRLLNHSRNGNCCTKVVDVNGTPHLILVAGRDIGVGEELQYDYGDRDKESLAAHPWLAL